MANKNNISSNFPVNTFKSLLINFSDAIKRYMASRVRDASSYFNTALTSDRVELAEFLLEEICKWLDLLDNKLDSDNNAIYKTVYLPALRMVKKIHVTNRHLTLSHQSDQLIMTNGFGKFELTLSRYIIELEKLADCREVVTSEQLKQSSLLNIIKGFVYWGSPSG